MNPQVPSSARLSAGRFLSGGTSLPGRLPGDSVLSWLPCEVPQSARTEGHPLNLPATSELPG